MSKRYTRRDHDQIGRYRVSAPLVVPNALVPIPNIAVWAVCHDHAYHLLRNILRDLHVHGLTIKDVVCVEATKLQSRKPYKEVRDMCLLFNKLEKEG